MLRRDFITLLGSAAIARPLSVLAEQGKVAKIGVLLLGYPDPSRFIKGLREGLRDLGYDEGRSIELIIRSADGKSEALASLAADLIRSQVNIIVAYPTTAGLAGPKSNSRITHCRLWRRFGGNRVNCQPRPAWRKRDGR